MIPESQSKWAWTRRAFLRTAMAGFTLAAARLPVPSLAWADQLPQGRLTFVNVWSDERLAVTYRNEAGEYDLEALDDVNRIFRCHHTGEVAAIDVRTRCPAFSRTSFRSPRIDCSSSMTKIVAIGTL